MLLIAMTIVDIAIFMCVILSMRILVVMMIVTAKLDYNYDNK
jgi:hypothetical protein